jgi:hypothetical protein
VDETIVIEKSDLQHLFIFIAAGLTTLLLNHWHALTFRVNIVDVVWKLDNGLPILLVCQTVCCADQVASFNVHQIFW